MTVRRPTFKEARRLYNILTQISTEAEEQAAAPAPIVINKDKQVSRSDKLENPHKGVADSNNVEDLCVSTSSDKESVVLIETPLHEAAKAGDAEKVVELLEQGCDPCVVDERGRTAYMVANEKEVRNTFRRFMALNLDKWDWQAAKVPSPLTREMEESQNAKQVTIVVISLLHLQNILLL